ncbi:uncharacterized protein LOC128723029 [Anopheles nili]|uniref:uncharacterized protein LOC128723029 n=1 Tax=Anopheles nili TaxID=185578 RepID=UPI00237B8865|nr:uncharacterized protein LOC128723029 [Anopheles nili]
MSSSSASRSPDKRKKPLPYFMQKPDEGTLPSFQNRRTLADHVKDNMLCAGRKRYFQRIVYIGRYKKMSGATLRERFGKVVKDVQERTTTEIKLFGLMLSCDDYTMHMIESAEETIGEYMHQLAKVEDLSVDTRVVLVYNNINQRFFRKLVWRVFDYMDSLPQTELDQRDPNLIQSTIDAFLVKLFKLCKQVRAEELDENSAFKSLYLYDYCKEYTPDTALVEYLLTLPCLFTVQEYAAFYGRLPDVDGLRDRIWPIPKDLTPYDVFETGRYDVNLTFGDGK